MSYLQNNERGWVNRFEDDADSSLGDAEGGDAEGGDVENLTLQEAYEIERARTAGEGYYAENQYSYNTSTNVASTKFWTPKRKIITATTVALVIVATAVGVVLSNKSSPENSLNQISFQDVIEEDDGDGSPSSTAEDANEPTAIEPAAELISEEIIDGVVVYDVAAQQEVTVVEEPNVDLENITVFVGDLSDFIDSDVARVSVEADSAYCNDQGALLGLTMTTDLYQWEFGWELYRGNGSSKELWAYGPPEEQAYERLTKYRGQLCLPTGVYEMTFTDSAKDGMCCIYGKGGYKVVVGNVTVAESNTQEDDPFESRTYNFEVSDTTTTTTTTAATEASGTAPSDQDSPSNEPTVKPTPSPSSSPTPKPTPEPSNQPTAEELSSSTQANCVTVGIEILTDGFGAHTGYKFKGGDATFKERASGTMSSNTRYLDEVCVSPGNYDLIVEDIKGDGIEDPGYIAVYIGEERVLMDWQVQKKNITYPIVVGFDSGMTDVDIQWLEAHNLRRKQFHEAHDKEYRPLTWSPALTKGASEWAAKIVSEECVLSRQQYLGLGENLNAMVTNSVDGLEPDSFLDRWFDRKVDDENPGLQLTQVVWVATRYVGCSKLVGQLSNGQYCHVAICR